MLIVDLHTLQTVDVLHLINEVICQRLDSHDPQNIMRCRVAVHDVITLLDEITFDNGDVLALWNHVFHGLH